MAFLRAAPLLAAATFTLAGTLAGGLAGCSGPPLDATEVEDGFVVDEGKEDDFLSITAREYVFEATARVTVAAGTSEDEVKRLISLKHVAIAWFLNQYLVDKEHEDSNASYGGFGAMVKTGSYEDLEIAQVNETTWEFRFAQLVGGRDDLLRRIPLDDNGDIVLEIGKPSNEDLARLETNAEWYREAPWSAWDPSKVAADKKESLTFHVSRETASKDAWWDYDSLLADGKLDIDVHFGWDYHDAFHLKHSRAFYSWLVGRGFKSPVSSFDAYTRTSGPLTRKINANGKSVTVEVRIFYGKPGTDTDPDTDAGGIVLENDMAASLEHRDVIVYSGHSGPFYGFALANWKKTSEGDFDDADMLVAKMPADRYQIVVAEGCDTYMIGQAFKLNPNKQGKNVDVITTTSFSNASTPAAVQDFVARLIELDSNGRHRPRTMKALLEDLGDNSWGFNTMYGIHGVDDNPQVHPYANEDKVCSRCAVNADCGGPGNSCVRVGESGKRCVAACTDDAGCQEAFGAGYKCKRIASASSSTIYQSACVPTANFCE